MVEGRPDDLRDQLRARGGEQQRLGVRADLQVGVLEQRAEPLADLGAARLADHDRLVAQRVDEQPGLGRLARPVDALEGDEEAACHGGEASTVRAVYTMPRFMRALVTGGAGFIGSNLVDALVERGDEVTVVDVVSTGRRDNLGRALANGAQLVEGDIRDPEAVVEVCARFRPEVVFHLAAQIDVRVSVADPAFDARINVEGTVNVLRAAHANGARRVVNTSSGGAIYGEGRTIPAPEDHPVAPEAPYGLSKFCAEQYCELFTRLHGLSTVSLRYG